MKSIVATSICLISLSIIGCTAASERESAAASGSDLVSQLGASEVLSCGADAAIVGQMDGKATLVKLEPVGTLFTLAGKTDTLASVQSGLTCRKVTGAEAAPWATAAGLLDYAREIDGLASTVTEEMASFENQSNNANAAARSTDANPYKVFVVETAKRASYDLGTKVSGSAGALTSEDDAEGLDEQDWNYAGISAAYALGGGDDYGEWFQAASDGIYLSPHILPGLNGQRAGYIAHEKVKALGDVTDGTSAIEITVGKLTFLLPDGFSK